MHELNKSTSMKINCTTDEFKASENNRTDTCFADLYVIFVREKFSMEWDISIHIFANHELASVDFQFNWYLVSSSEAC